VSKWSDRDELPLSMAMQKDTTPPRRQVIKELLLLLVPKGRPVVDLIILTFSSPTNGGPGYTVEQNRRQLWLLRGQKNVTAALPPEADPLPVSTCPCSTGYGLARDCTPSHGSGVLVFATGGCVPAISELENFQMVHPRQLLGKVVPKTSHPAFQTAGRLNNCPEDVA